MVLGTGNLKIGLFMFFLRAVKFISRVVKVSPSDRSTTRWDSGQDQPVLEMKQVISPSLPQAGAASGVPHLSPGQEEQLAAVQ